MHMRRLWLALVFLLVPTLVHADDHRMRAFAAMSQAYRSILGGFYGAVDVTVPKPANHDVSVLGEFSIYGGSHEDVDETNITFLAGPSLALMPKDNQRFVFSGHVLMGVVSTDTDTDAGDDSSFGLAFGGAWDYIPGRPAHSNGFGARVQVDWVWGEGDAANFLRASVGATYTWFPRRTP
jgi:hypothetical protein